jgi:hypothetical protein
MADNNLFYYRGFPLFRSDNTIFYGSGGDAFAAKLTIKDTKPVNGTDVPNKIMVQLIPRSPADMSKGKKGDFTGFYEALDTAHVWLTEALFG